MIFIKIFLHQKIGNVKICLCRDELTMTQTGYAQSYPQSLWTSPEGQVLVSQSWFNRHGVVFDWHKAWRVHERW